MKHIKLLLFLFIGFFISCGSSDMENDQESGSKNQSSSKSTKENSLKGNPQQQADSDLSWNERIDKLQDAWDDAGEGVGFAMTEHMRDSAAYFEALKEKINKNQERLREKEARRLARENDPNYQDRKEKNREKHSLRFKQNISKDKFLETILNNYDSLWTYMGRPEKFSEVFAGKLDEKLEELDARRLDADMMSMTEQIMLESAELSLNNNIPSLSNAQATINKAEKVKVDQMLKNGEVSEEFVRKYKFEIKSAIRLLDKRKKLAETAKAKFKKLNPDLYFSDELEDTYFDRKNNAVYLPMGKLSFADQVVSYIHPKGDTNQSDALGEPNYRVKIKKTNTYSKSDNVYSLGASGELIVQFTNNALVDVNGPDLFIFEIGKIEPTQLSISTDGKKWIEVGKIEGGTAEIDIAEFVSRNELYYFVKLKDLETSSGVPGADVDAIAAIGSAIRLQLDSKVLFDSGKSKLKPEGVLAIKELVKNIQVLKSGKIIVEGHTDDTGSDQSNKTLSIARAKSVSKELQKHISKKNFSFKDIGYGEKRPKVKNDSDENRAKNRRVEILVIPK